MRVLALAADALATPALRRVQLAWACAAVGGWAFMVVLAVHAYAVGGAAAVGVAALSRMLPAGAAAPLLGLAADRFPRRDVLVAAALGRAGLLVAMAVAVADHAPLAVVLVLASAVTVLMAAHKPAQAALLPLLAPEEQRRTAANALWSGIDNGGFVVGAVAGGVLAGAAGPATAFAASGAMFLAAAALLAGIPRDRPSGPVGPARRSQATDPFAGLGLIAGDGRLRLLLGVLSASTLLEGMIDVLVVVTALDLLDLGDAGVGWLNAAWGVGGLLGGAVALGLVARGATDRALGVGGLLAGLPLVALAAAPAPVAALLALAVLGAGYSLVEVGGLTILQGLAHDGVRARAFAVAESSYWLTTGAGAMLAPALLAVAGPRAALAVAGVALPAVVLARWSAVRGLLGPAAAAGAGEAPRTAERAVELV